MTVLLSAAVDATIVLALTLVVATALRHRSAALRHAVLATGIVGAAMTPLFELVVPQVPLVRWTDAAPAASSGLTFSAAAAASDAVAVTSAAPEAAPFPWMTLLAAAWASGAALALAGVLTGLVRLRRLTRRCTPVLEGSWREMTDRLSRARGLPHVQILQSADASLLVTCGVLKPKIILPAGAESWSLERQHIVLAHELAHVRRRDGAMQLAGELLRTMHWFNPLVVVACRRLRHESEHACDDAVLREGIDATDYATHLLDVARHAGRQPAWIAAPAIAHASTLERRISSMLNQQQNRQPLTRRAWLGAIVAGAAIVVPLAAAGVAPTPSLQPVPSAAAVDVTLGAQPLASTAAQPSRAPANPKTASAPAVSIAAARTPAAAVTPASPAAPVLQATAVFSGTVVDPSGGVLPGVQLAFTSIETGSRSVVSDGSGRFAFRDLLPARYELVASIPGFATVTTVVSVAGDSNLQRVITLPIGELQETIQLVCSVAAIAPTPRQPVTTTRTNAIDQVLVELYRVVYAFAPTVSAQERPVPVRVGGNIQAPRKIKDVKPACPSTVRPSTETTVRLRGRIGVDGYLNDLRQEPGEPGNEPLQEFVESALDAVRQWQFTPTRLNGEPTEATIRIQVRYRP